MLHFVQHDRKWVQHDREHLLQCPFGAVLSVLDLDTKSLEVVTDAVRCSPVLCCLRRLSLFEDHVHKTVYGLHCLSTFSAFLIAKSEDAIYNVVEQADKY